MGDVEDPGGWVPVFDPEADGFACPEPGVHHENGDVGIDRIHVVTTLIPAVLKKVDGLFEFLTGEKILGGFLAHVLLEEVKYIGW